MRGGWMDEGKLFVETSSVADVPMLCFRSRRKKEFNLLMIVESSTSLRKLNDLPDKEVKTRVIEDHDTIFLLYTKSVPPTRSGGNY